MNIRLRFRDVSDLSEALSAWLQSLGQQPDSRVALMIPSVPQYLVVIAAVLRAGLVVVNADSLDTARKLQHQLWGQRRPQVRHQTL